ncbi:sodium-potassium/proton antiporter ChaA, partial [Pantoea agglomerans]|nr:sodium-potassium/proton antiporter ChaA [Pantoea agglomerans]
MPSHEKTRHKEFSLILPLITLGILYFFGATTSFPIVVGINLVALVAILSSAFSV